MDNEHAEGFPHVSRRTVFKLAATGAAGLTGPNTAVDASSATIPAAQTPIGTPTVAEVPRITARFVVNGTISDLDVDPRMSLLDVLREELGQVGAKKGCDHGQCGACTIHLDGQRVASCLTLAAQAHDRPITTIEGIRGQNGDLHPMQQAFIDHDALQCGYCTPGQIMAAIGCVFEGNAGSDTEIREAMSGNLCRCGAYAGIVAAIRDAAPKMERE